MPTLLDRSVTILLVLCVSAALGQSQVGSIRATNDRWIDIDHGGQIKGASPKYTEHFAYTEAVWQKIIRPLSKPLNSPDMERFMLAQAALVFDKITGDKMVEKGYERDLGGLRANISAGQGKKGQMNCQNTASNMERFLRQVEAERLLKFHTVLTCVPRTWLKDVRDSSHTPGVARDAIDLTEHWSAAVGQLPSSKEEYAAGHPDPAQSAVNYEKDPEKAGKLFAVNHAWVFDRWMYDVAAAKILVQKKEEWERYKRYDGLSGREIELEKAYAP